MSSQTRLDSVRRLLGRLSWPVEEMTDGQVKAELYRRWFDQYPTEDTGDAPLSIASALGIVVVMTREGNLDALCWSSRDCPPNENVVSEAEGAVVTREPGHPPAGKADRRRSRRQATRDLVTWTDAWGAGSCSTGWLVDRSREGVAFIAQREDAPGVGTEVVPTMCLRTGRRIELGLATIIRSEPLTHDLTLVCAQLDEPMEM